MPCGLTRMQLSPEQEELCERMEKGEPALGAAALIQQAKHESGTDSVMLMRSSP
jgi:hypothetical protein